MLFRGTICSLTEDKPFLYRYSNTIIPFCIVTNAMQSVHYLSRLIVQEELEVWIRKVEDEEVGKDTKVMIFR